MDAGDILRRVPPQNIEAEESVLGAILLDNHTVDAVLEVVDASDFYRESHRLIFQAMVDLTDRGAPIDAVTLTDALRDKGVLEQIGGPAYIADLAIRVPTAVNAVYYSRIVQQKAALRHAAAVYTELASGAYDAGDADEYQEQAEHKTSELSERRAQSSLTAMPDLMDNTLKLVERLYENHALVTGVPTGYTDLDRLTAGLQPGDLVVIAGRPSMGKTALALNIAENAAIEAKIGVAFFFVGNVRGATRSPSALLARSRRHGEGAERFPRQG